MREKIEIISTEKLTNNKWLNLFSRKYIDTRGEEKEWIFSSRKEYPERDKDKVDAVIIVPMIINYDTKKTNIVVTSEYRVTIDGYELGFPAGLIDEGEDIEAAAARELFEETGLEIDDIVSISPPIYSAIGMTDEKTVIVYAYCSGNIDTSKNEGSEDINAFTLDREEVSSLLNPSDIMASLIGGNINFGAKAWIILKMFADTGEVI